jgi:Fe(3+) dicitrate transport protein
MKSSLRLLCLCGLAPLALAQQPAPPAAAAANPAPGTVLDTVTVYGEAEDDAVIQPPFPLAVEGDKIFVGKRATVIDLDALPKVQANNYRQALALTPGLLFSEETTPLVSIGYRGIGEPHRMQFMQVLKDGIPIHADPFGYPEAYYTPPLDTVDRIEFIRGGGSLMYGPQPGGAFNYVTYLPQRESPFAFRTQNIYGSDELFSSYSAVDGTIGQLGYLGYFNHREWQGFRQANSQYKLNGGHGKLVWSIDDDTRLIFGFDGYEEEHGEPGGLTRRDFARNPEKTTRLHDEFRLRRYAGTLELQHRIQPGTELNIKTWGGYYQRWSKRQRTSGPLFGARPTGANAATNTIENQEFYTFGFEPRLRHDWEAWGGQHTLAAGMQFYYADAPRVDQRGSSPDAESGVTFLDSDRSTTYGSFFAENKFTFGRFSITPGFRMEMVKQHVRKPKLQRHQRGSSPVKSTKSAPANPAALRSWAWRSTFDNQTQLYANVSQSYRTTIFTESIVAQPGLTATDTDPSLGWSYELGYRGTPREWFAFDTSLFLIDLDNRFGVAGGRLRSVGRSINYGWDGAVQFDLIGGLDAARGTKLGDSLGALNLYGNVSLLEAQLHGGPNDGATPQYAPDFILRTGLIYQRKGVKVSFLGTFVDDHNARDDATQTFSSPAT